MDTDYDVKKPEHLAHLENLRFSDIAFQLDTDMWGDNGSLSKREIHEHLIEAIHEATKRQYVTTGHIPVECVADLIRAVWEHKNWEASVNLCPDGPLFG